jgi:DNA-binding transcriptional LysR family regulator
VLRENGEDVTLWRLAPAGAAEGAPAGGGWTSVRVHPRLATNDGEVARAWAVAGRGVVLRSEWDVADDLRAGRLERVLDGYAPPPADVVALLGPRAGRSGRVARFLEHLAGSLTPAPWRRAGAGGPA